MDRQPTATDRKRCAARKLDGTPCRAWAVAGTDRCVFHPETVEARALSRQANARGGVNSGRLPRAMKSLPPDLRAVYDRLAQALEQVHAGTLEPGPASAMANLSRAMVGVLDAAESLRRIAELERALNLADAPVDILTSGCDDDKT